MPDRAERIAADIGPIVIPSRRLGRCTKEQSTHSPQQAMNTYILLFGALLVDIAGGGVDLALPT